MKSELINICLSDLLTNIAAGYFGLVLFSPYLKSISISIFINLLNGIVFFVLAVKIKEYGSSKNI